MPNNLIRLNLASGLFRRLGGNSSTGDHLLSVLEGRSPAMSDVKVLSDFQPYAERPKAPESCDSRAFMLSLNQLRRFRPLHRDVCGLLQRRHTALVHGSA